MARERLLAVEAALRRESEAIRHTGGQIAAATVRVRAEPTDELAMYGLAALLDTAYTGIEKALSRAISAFEGVPTGPAWHRELLEQASLVVEGVRPAVISVETVGRLEDLRAFRHRFRNLYLFELDAEALLAVAEACPSVVEAFERDLRGFRAALAAAAG